MLGNNLFAFVLGSVLIIGMLAYDQGLLRDFTEGGLSNMVARIPPLIGIIVLALYYLIDRYDLNLAIYIDAFVGRVQVITYVLAALVVAAIPPLILGGKTDIAAILAAVYFPIADRHRNRLLHDGIHHVTTFEDALTYKEHVGSAKTLRVFLWVASVIALGMALWSLISGGVNSMPSVPPIATAIGLVVMWLLACILKVLRSVHLLQVVYEERLQDLGYFRAPGASKSSQHSTCEKQSDSKLPAPQQKSETEESDGPSAV